MTTWSVQYGDETGHSMTRTTDDIENIHETLRVIVKDEERTAGYAGQTATWHGYNSRDDDPYATGNWTLDIVNLDTHTPDGYTIEEAAELQADFYGADLVEGSEDDAFDMGRATTPTNYTVVVTLEADMPTAPMDFGTDSKGADSAARMATAILAGTGEPQPLRATHDTYRTVYRASGYHDTFGEWSVDLIAYDRGEICGTCGEWFRDSDAWGEHNDMAHY